MAENKLLLKRDADQDFLSDDDPLAELARIVGIDGSSAVRPAAPQRREPAFDLEDELLKELEIYAQPAAEVAALPAHEQVGPARDLASEPAVDVALPVAEEAVAEKAPVVLEAVETYADVAEGRVYERPASHPVFDLEDEILREFAAFDARRVTAHEEHAVAAEVVRQDMSALADIRHDVTETRSPAQASVEGRGIYDSFLGDDLDAAISQAADPGAETAPVVAEYELEPSIDDRFEAVSEPLTDIASSAPYDAPPIAGEGVLATAETSSADAAGDALTYDAPVDEAAVHDDHDGELVGTVAYDVADEVPGQPMAPAHSDMAAMAAAAPRTDLDYGLDDLLAEVERYPVADSAGRWGVHSKPVAAEDVARAAPPLVQDFVPLDADVVDDEAAEAPAQDLDFAEIEAEIAFDESQLEIDLGEIDLDMSDLKDPDIAISPDVLSELADADIRDEAVAAPRAVAVSVPLNAPVAHAAADYSSLPFDPSQIVQEEDVVEAIAEMDVPDVPVVHDEDRPTQHPEYDLDLDAEMAHLFATATAPASASQRSGQEGAAAAEQASARPQAAALDLDEFERALEEDFRRSFTENRNAAVPDRVPLAPVSNAAGQGGSRRGLMLMASAAVAIVVFGGAGVYAYMSGDTPILASSEPKVILADTEPVKIVPDEPGGKQVPNQNKAVYDRVSGEKSDQLKQESLLSSNEEPIDVVQRTLEPENLPMDDDSLAMATPTGDTVDPRLLPDEAEQERVTTTNKVVSGVSPRKVKTMVVRPDGSLVEREVTEEDLKQQATNDAELLKIAQKAATDAETASNSQSDDIAKAIDSVPERLAASDEAANDKSSRMAAKVDTANVDPIDAERVDDQPVVAETPVVKPVEDAAASVDATESKSVERSIAVESRTTPVEQSAVAEPVVVEDQSAAANPGVTADQDALAAAADAEVEDAPVRKVKTTTIAPVPEVRPVDQPVTVVGTETDESAVRSDAAEKPKPQEVAVAEQATQNSVETTPVPAGSYVIQIASLPSEAEAQTSYSRLSSKFAGIIGGRGVDIRRAEIKNKGTYYRVRIPAGSKQEAQALCSKYKAAGGSCLVSK